MLFGLHPFSFPRNLAALPFKTSLIILLGFLITPIVEKEKVSK